MWHVRTEYEQSDNSADQQSEDVGDWGHCDTRAGFTRDNSENHIRDPTDI